ncbi:hypothetical protein [Haloferax larsenii]|uniref:DUF7982 domain-containing protein n=1 Tax=Haloferax larsenii TaxID=302484 RepID=A0A1H7PS84_HALLR|nr:hypothetical protein [Haloferax larsenii]SEL38469.1 hypothetical protein SAMN04488691_104178 [Haloferax larsenii]
MHTFDSETAVTESDVASLAARIDELEAENQRLRAESRELRQVRYRRVALGFAVVGVLSFVAGWYLPASQTVLFGLGGVGLFASLLMVSLVPTDIVAAPTASHLRAAHAATVEGLVSDLGLHRTTVYVPTPSERPEIADVRLYIPQHREYEVPSPPALHDVFVVTEDERNRGVSLPPSGGALLVALDRDEDVPLLDADEIVERLPDAIVEGFELANGVEIDADIDAGRISVSVSGSALEDAELLDHPVGSLVASALARALGTEVTLTVETDTEEPVFVCRWDPKTTQDERRAETETSGLAA